MCYNHLFQIQPQFVLKNGGMYINLLPSSCRFFFIWHVLKLSETSLATNNTGRNVFVQSRWPLYIIRCVAHYLNAMNDRMLLRPDAHFVPTVLQCLMSVCSVFLTVRVQWGLVPLFDLVACHFPTHIYTPTQHLSVYGWLTSLHSIAPVPFDLLMLI